MHRCCETAASTDIFGWCLREGPTGRRRQIMPGHPAISPSRSVKMNRSRDKLKTGYGPRGQVDNISRCNQISRSSEIDRRRIGLAKHGTNRPLHVSPHLHCTRCNVTNSRRRKPLAVNEVERQTNEVESQTQEFANGRSLHRARPRRASLMGHLFWAPVMSRITSSSYVRVLRSEGTL